MLTASLPNYLFLAQGIFYMANIILFGWCCLEAFRARKYFDRTLARLLLTAVVGFLVLSLFSVPYRYSLPITLSLAPLGAVWLPICWCILFVAWRKKGPAAYGANLAMDPGLVASMAASGIGIALWVAALWAGLRAVHNNPDRLLRRLVRATMLPVAARVVTGIDYATITPSQSNLLPFIALMGIGLAIWLTFPIVVALSLSDAVKR